jgi:hypothetical protein
VAMYAGSDAFFCLSMRKTRIYPLPTIVLPFCGVMEVTFYGLALASVIYIRKTSLKMSQKAKMLNGQLSLLLLLQVSPRAERFCRNFPSLFDSVSKFFPSRAVHHFQPVPVPASSRTAQFQSGKHFYFGPLLRSSAIIERKCPPPGAECKNF